MVFFGDKEILFKKMGRYFEEYQINTLREQLGTSRGTTYLMDTGQLILYMPNEPEDIDGLVTLNHEILHCTIALLRRVGMSLSFDSEEAYTYLHEYITRMIYSKLRVFKKLVSLSLT